MLPPRAIPALGLLLTLAACGGSNALDDAGSANLAPAGSAGSSAGTGGSGAAPGAGGTTANGGSADDIAAQGGGPCDDHGGGTCGPTEYCSYANAPACGVGGTCVARPGGCITIENPKRPCMCDGDRTRDACAGMMFRGESPAPFSTHCHPGEDFVVCSAEQANGPGCGTREYCDTTGAAGSSTTGVCRPLPAP